MRFVVWYPPLPGLPTSGPDKQLGFRILLPRPHQSLLRRADGSTRFNYSVALAAEGGQLPTQLRTQLHTDVRTAGCPVSLAAVLSVRGQAAVCLGSDFESEYCMTLADVPKQNGQRRHALHTGQGQRQHHIRDEPQHRAVRARGARVDGFLHKPAVKTCAQYQPN